MPDLILFLSRHETKGDAIAVYRIIERFKPGTLLIENAIKDDRAGFEQRMKALSAGKAKPEEHVNPYFNTIDPYLTELDKLIYKCGLNIVLEDSPVTRRMVEAVVPLGFEASALFYRGDIENATEQYRAALGFAVELNSKRNRALFAQAKKLLKNKKTSKPVLCTIGANHQKLAKDLKKLGVKLVYDPERYSFSPKEMIEIGLELGKKFSDSELMRFAFIEAELIKYFRYKGRTDAEMVAYFKELKKRLSMEDLEKISIETGRRAARLNTRDLISYCTFKGPEFIAKWVKKNKSLSF